MVEITITDNKANFEMIGWHKLWSLRSRLEIPLEHIKAAYIDHEPAMGWFAGLKLAGTDIPHIFRAGIYYQEGNFVFWDVHDPAKAIVVDLVNHKYNELVIEVEDPIGDVQKIQKVATGQNEPCSERR